MLPISAFYAGGSDIGTCRPEGVHMHIMNRLAEYVGCETESSTRPAQLTWKLNSP